MGGGVKVGAGEDLGFSETQEIKALVVTDVKVIKRTMNVDVPKYIPKEQTKYNTIVEDTTKFNKVEENTTKFNKVEEDTTKYIKKEEDTIKYKLKLKDYEVERPVPDDKKYERPVVIPKEYKIATYGDVEALQKLFELVPKMMSKLQDLELKLAGIIDYKLVEEDLKVPRIKWIPREEQRIVWKDVIRERCKDCGKEVD